jgi:hypothetical protein
MLRIKLIIASLILTFSVSAVTFAQEGPYVFTNTTGVYTDNAYKTQRITDVIHKHAYLDANQYSSVYKIVYSNLETHGSKANWGHLKQDLRDVLDKNQLKQVQGAKSDIVSIWKEDSLRPDSRSDNDNEKKWKDRNDDNKKDKSNKNNGKGKKNGNGNGKGRNK